MPGYADAEFLRQVDYRAIHDVRKVTVGCTTCPNEFEVWPAAVGERTQCRRCEDGGPFATDPCPYCLEYACMCPPPPPGELPDDACRWCRSFRCKCNAPVPVRGIG